MFKTLVYINFLVDERNTLKISFNGYGVDGNKSCSLQEEQRCALKENRDTSRSI